MSSRKLFTSATLSLKTCRSIPSSVQGLPRVAHHGTCRTPAASCLRYSSTTASSNPEGTTILERIRADVKTSMRSKDRTRTTVLKAVLSDIAYAEKKAKLPLTLASDPDVVPLIQQSLAKRAESIRQYREGGREDLAGAEETEVKLLEEYLPKQMGEEELAEKVKEVVEGLGAKSVKEMGKVLNGLADLDATRVGKARVAAAVRKLLGA